MEPLRVVGRYAIFDEIAAGYHGTLYLEIVPRTFAIRVKTGLALNQVRLLAGDARLSDLETSLRTIVPGETFRLDVPGWFGALAPAAQGLIPQTSQTVKNRAAPLRMRFSEVSV